MCLYLLSDQRQLFELVLRKAPVCLQLLSEHNCEICSEMIFSEHNRWLLKMSNWCDLQNVFKDRGEGLLLRTETFNIIKILLKRWGICLIWTRRELKCLKLLLKIFVPSPWSRNSYKIFHDFAKILYFSTVEHFRQVAYNSCLLFNLKHCMNYEKNHIND